MKLASSKRMNGWPSTMLFHDNPIICWQMAPISGGREEKRSWWKDRPGSKKRSGKRNTRSGKADPGVKPKPTLIFQGYSAVPQTLLYFLEKEDNYNNIILIREIICVKSLVCYSISYALVMGCGLISGVRGCRTQSQRIAALQTAASTDLPAFGDRGSHGNASLLTGVPTAEGMLATLQAQQSAAGTCPNNPRSGRPGRLD